MPRVRSLRYVRGSRLSVRPTEDMKNMESAMVQRGLVVERVEPGEGEEDAALPPALGWLELLELLEEEDEEDEEAGVVRVLRAAARSSREVEVADIAVLPFTPEIVKFIK